MPRNYYLFHLVRAHSMSLGTCYVRTTYIGAARASQTYKAKFPFIHIHCSAIILVSIRRRDPTHPPPPLPSQTNVLCCCS